jgi:hypothetical protein
MDNGVQFGRSREFQNFFNNYEVKSYYNSLYAPQNNPTERVNRTDRLVYRSGPTEMGRKFRSRRVRLKNGQTRGHQTHSVLFKFRKRNDRSRLRI